MVGIHVHRLARRAGCRWWTPAHLTAAASHLVEIAGWRIPLDEKRRPVREGRAIIGIRPEDFEDVAFAESGRPEIEVEVSSKVLCTKLTKDEYRAKRKELEALVAAGTLTQAELDEYEVELVKCLQ